jgi:hypothetical protein
MFNMPLATSSAYLCQTCDVGRHETCYSIQFKIEAVISGISQTLRGLGSPPLRALLVNLKNHPK